VAIAEKSALKECSALLAGVAAGVVRSASDGRWRIWRLMRSGVDKKKSKDSFCAGKAAGSGPAHVKDAGRVGLMERAAALGCRNLFETMLPPWKRDDGGGAGGGAGFRGKEAGELEGMSFRDIVASGHDRRFRTGGRRQAKLPRKDSNNGLRVLSSRVICSDMTRTVTWAVLRVRSVARVYAVLEAQETAWTRVKPGATCGEVDQAAGMCLDKGWLG